MGTGSLDFALLLWPNNPFTIMGGRGSHFSFLLFFFFFFFNKKGFTPQEQINHFELLINTAAVKRKMATCMQ